MSQAAVRLIKRYSVFIPTGIIPDEKCSLIEDKVLQTLVQCGLNRWKWQDIETVRDEKSYAAALAEIKRIDSQKRK